MTSQGLGLTEATLDRMLENENLTRMRFIRRLERSPIDDLLHTGEILGPLELTHRDRRCIRLEGPGYYSSFRTGDQIQVRRRASCVESEQVGHAHIFDVVYPAAGRLAVDIGGLDPLMIRPKREYFIFPTENEHLLNQLRRSVVSCASSLTHKRQCLECYIEYERLEDEYQLNMPQLEALHYVLSEGEDRSVQGPPGTGKTELLRSIV